jgi:hypothetical protein
MNQTGEFHSWDVAAGTINTINVPTGLRCFGEVVRQESCMRSKNDAEKGVRIR